MREISLNDDENNELLLSNETANVNSDEQHSLKEIVANNTRIKNNNRLHLKSSFKNYFSKVKFKVLISIVLFTLGKTN